jgi:hypothetical protein
VFRPVDLPASCIKDAERAGLPTSAAEFSSHAEKQIQDVRELSLFLASTC